MPGIAGIISRRPVAECEREVKVMTAIMRREKFHASGMFSAPELGVFAGWVAHEHSFADGQVFQNETKEVALLFSGECFVADEVKASLRRAGHSFGGGGDCLVHLYEEQGEGFIAGLNGLFSGLLIDRRQKRVFLFDDRYPMERIYWHQTADAFYFASEAKALLRVLPHLREFDPECVAELAGVNCVLGVRTLFRGIERLPGGACWSFANGDCRRGNYFSPTEWEALPKLAPALYEAKLRETFLKIAPRYFEAESKVGVALTGGLDTRMIMAARPPQSGEPVCYTFTGPRGKTLDDRVAARVAKACGLKHHLLRLNPDFYSTFAGQVDQTVYGTDATFGAYGAHEIYFHRQARLLAPIRLTGNYGSEILRAITTFKPLGLTPEMFTPDFARSVAGAAGRWAAEKGHPDTFAVFKEVPWNIFGSVAAGRSQVSFRTPYLDNELVALSYQCPVSLKKSSLPTMRFVKSCSPALDRIATDRGFISDRSGPDILCRRIFAEATFKFDYHYNAGLPRRLAVFNPFLRLFAESTGIAGLHKFLQYGLWMQRDLAPYLRDRAAAAAAQAGRFWSGDFLKQMAESHISGRKNYSAEINAVLTLEATERLLLRDLPRGLEPD
jgi:asparagine synthase (glutamine-hydrolysing)